MKPCLLFYKLFNKTSTMENESIKKKRGRMVIGVITGLAVGAILGFIGGIRTRDVAVLWLLIGIICGIIIGIGISRLFSSGKKNT
jgi:uncharacterized ion transporter superfamily protein YfcC